MADPHPDPRVRLAARVTFCVLGALSLFLGIFLISAGWSEDGGRGIPAPLVGIMALVISPIFPITAWWSWKRHG
jgi:hypothetical protein